MNEHDTMIHMDDDDGCPFCAIMEGEEVIPIEELERRGVRLRRPEELSAEELPAAIAEAGRELAKLRVFLEFTDHLSDEELLYRRSYYKTLQEWSWISPDDSMRATHIDFACPGSDEDHLSWLTLYAGEEDRRDELRWNPGTTLPERLPLPYDRSKMLPRATHGEEAGA